MMRTHIELWMRAEPGAKCGHALVNFDSGWFKCNFGLRCNPKLHLKIMSLHNFQAMQFTTSYTNCIRPSSTQRFVVTRLFLSLFLVALA
ncbi:hypothetical protein Mapa_002016 [Marchantia paleacea]|nr:hypothetical protein Mapa_002016 [Marchantia paleacea]